MVGHSGAREENATAVVCCAISWEKCELYSQHLLADIR